MKDGLGGPSEAPYGVSPPDESLEELLTRDLNAWLEAKAAIAKAKLHQPSAQLREILGLSA